MTAWKKVSAASRRGQPSSWRHPAAWLWYDRRVKNEFTAIVEPAEEGGFWAYCLEVPGANGQGETIEETVDDLRLGIEMMLAYLREERSAEMSAAAERRVVTVAG